MFIAGIEIFFGLIAGALLLGCIGSALTLLFVVLRGIWRFGGEQ